MNMRINVLASAYACHPQAPEGSFPGEAILGWNLIKQISNFPQVSSLHVLTRTYNRKALEAAKAGMGSSKVEFHYVALPRTFELLLKNFFGFRLYYLFWQIQAFRTARRLCCQTEFHVFHQITFNNDWMPSFIGAFSPLPFVWGPVGGGQSVPRNLVHELEFKDRWIEFLRLLGQRFWRSTYFRRKGLRRASAVLVCNPETMKLVYPLNRHVYFFPVNGISMSEIPSRRLESKCKDRAFDIVYAGRLDPIKGIPLGVRAFKEFHEKSPSSRLEIIGEGPQERYLRQLARSLGLEAEIIFTPWLSREELLRRMSRADVFLFPSFRDGGGAVVVEAMACGTPVLCLNTGGPAFHIQDEWGVKVEPKNPQFIISEMAKSLEALYLGPDQRKKMGERARARAEEYYQWDRLGEKLRTIYEGVAVPKHEHAELK